MPSGFRQIAPGRLEVREGGGRIAIFGLPFLSVGVVAGLIGVGVIPLQNHQILGGTSVAALLVIGLTFTLVGGTLVCGRSWTILNSADRTLVKQAGLLVPMWTKTYRIDDYNGVLLEFVRGDSDSADQYPVSLKARAGRNLRLFSSTEYADARAGATAIAALFLFEIEDSTSGRAVRMSAAQAALPFQHRQRIEHQRDEPVARPSFMRSNVTDSNGIVTIVIPATRVHPILFLVFVVPTAVPLLLVEPFSRFFRQSQTPDVVAWIFLGFLIVVFGVMPTLTGMKAFLKSRFGRTTITASAAGIKLEERGVWKTRMLASLSTADIMDVDYTPDATFGSARNTAAEVQARRPSMAAPPVGKGAELILRIVRTLVGTGGVTIKTRNGLTAFGQGLEDRELRYLHYIVRRALVHGPS